MIGDIFENLAHKPFFLKTLLIKFEPYFTACWSNRRIKITMKLYTVVSPDVFLTLIPL